ncbi:MAG: STAS domain-containing protein [Scytonema sp. PMC 1069.18]|nr:STAS domain-containing protein [Scytonema sp. PMC 1069.18]MEC4880416.1 STAS domain-containing protein [Scytonema sp. PMC 1070.18]
MQATLDYPTITVIRPQGCISGTKSLEFETHLRTALTRDGVSTLLVDLESVELLDCAGLMALVSALKLAQTLKRRFSLCSMSPSLRMMFELTQLDKVFEIFDGKAAFDAACLPVEKTKLVCA